MKIIYLCFIQRIFGQLDLFFHYKIEIKRWFNEEVDKISFPFIDAFEGLPSVARQSKEGRCTTGPLTCL